MRRELMEALNRIRSVFIDFEKTIHSGQFQNHRRRRGDRSKLDVAIPFHDLFQATQQHLDACAVQLPHPGEIEYQAWPVSPKQRLQLPKISVYFSQNEPLR